jgi:hypothetical protein
MYNNKGLSPTVKMFYGQLPYYAKLEDRHETKKMRLGPVGRTGIERVFLATVDQETRSPTPEKPGLTGD